jgi:hypothetical protein
MKRMFFGSSSTKQTLRDTKAESDILLHNFDRPDPALLPRKHLAGWIADLVDQDLASG